MSIMTKMKTHEWRKPSPGQPFATWIQQDHLELNVRKVAKEFAEWINSGGQKFEWQGGLKKICLELTELTVDLTRELRQVRGDFTKVRFVGPAAYVSVSRGDRKRRAIIQRYRGQINRIVTRLQRTKPLLQLSDLADPDGMPAVHDTFAFLVEKDLNLYRFDQARAAAYALKQWRFLVKGRAFAAFRRCALRTCNKYFFPLRPERRYCSDACQGKDYMDDPLRTKKNAAYQKVNYYAKKVLELGKLATVNADRREEYDQAKKALKSAKAKLRALSRG